MSTKEAKTDPDLLWDESESKELLKALKQPLLIQTPLQVMLESIFSKMKAQTNAFLDMKEKVELITRNDLSATELLDRVKLLEGMVKELTHSKLSPFMQAEILRRLEAVESLTGRAWDVTNELKTEKNKDIVPRLQRIEVKLQGVYNLPGKLIAVEDMARELGMEIADLEYSSPYVEGSKDDFRRMDSLASGAPSSSSISQSQSIKAPNTTTSTPSSAVESTTPASAGTGPASATAAAVAAGVSGESSATQAGSRPSATSAAARSTTGPGTGNSRKPSSRLMDLEAEMAVQRENAVGAHRAAESLRDELKVLQRHLAEAQDNTAGRLTVIEEVQNGFKANLAAEVQALRTEIHKEPQVSYADLAKLETEITKAAALAAQGHDMATYTREKEVPRIDAVLDVHKSKIDQLFLPREIDSVFNNKISALESDVAAHKDTVKAALAALEEASATKADIVNMKEAMDLKASKEDVRQAVTAHTHSIVRTVQEQMSPHLLSALAGPHQDSQPMGPSGFKLRCLSCNSELPATRPTPVGPLPSSRGFLPKLDGVVNKYGEPPNPMGPGVNAAEMRRLAESRLHGAGGAGPPGTADTTGTRATSPGMGHTRSSFSSAAFTAEFDGWLTENGEPPRTPAQGSNTVKYSFPSAPYSSQSQRSSKSPNSPQKGSGQPKTPVFA